MKKLLILTLLLTTSTLARAQETFSSEMYVMTIEADTVTVEFRKIVMGHTATEFCVNTGISRCFKLEKLLPTNDDFYGTMISSVGDRYSLRMAHDDRGLVVWITNLDGYYPHLVLSTHEPKKY